MLTYNFVVIVVIYIMKVTLLTTNNEFVDAIRTAKSNNKEINIGVQGDLKDTINASKIDKIQIEVEL